MRNARWTLSRLYRTPQRVNRINQEVKLNEANRGNSMAVIVTSDNPRKLLSEMKSAIRDGKIQSWVVDKDGDFTLQQEQWKDRAWLHPVVTEGKVTFNILSPSLSHLGFRWPHNVLGRRKRSHV